MNIGYYNECPRTLILNHSKQTLSLMKIQQLDTTKDNSNFIHSEILFLRLELQSFTKT